MKKQPQTVYIIAHSDFQRVVDYVMSVPTGTLPGSRLAETLNILDNLTMVPAHAVPILEQALRAINQSPPAPPVPSAHPVSPTPPDKKSNGVGAQAE